MKSFSAGAKTKFMRAALRLSRKALPACQPNPPVGCVVVGENGVVSEGFTGAPGEPHAEAAAITALPPEVPRHDLAAFVTLEPCSFHGRTPPCTDALIHGGVVAVYVAIVDPDPRNNGAGLRALEDAGLHVELGILEQRVRAFLSPHLTPKRFESGDQPL